MAKKNGVKSNQIAKLGDKKVMKNNIFVLDLTAMPTFIYAHLGALVFTPNIIYFISTGEVIKSSRGWPALISKIDYVLNEKSKIDFKQFENIDNYIEKLAYYYADKGIRDSARTIFHYLISPCMEKKVYL